MQFSSIQFLISSRMENRQMDGRIFKIRVIKNVFSEQFCLSDAEDNTSGPLNRGG